MLRAHRQAWAWQDEWYGLSMSDIREIERQTQEALRKKMAQGEDDEGDDDDDEDDGTAKDTGADTQSYASNKSDDKASIHSADWTSQKPVKASVKENKSSSSSSCDEPTQFSNPTPVKVKISDLSDSKSDVQNVSQKERMGPNVILTKSTTNLNSPGSKSNKSFELMGPWKMEGLMKKDSEDEEGSDDEFFDCLGIDLLHI